MERGATPRKQEELYLSHPAITHLGDVFSFNSAHAFTPDPANCELCNEIANSVLVRLQALAERNRAND